MEAKLVARKNCGVSATRGPEGRGQGDQAAVNQEAADHFKVFCRIGNEVAFRWDGHAGWP